MSEKNSTIENEEIKRALLLFPYFDTWDDNVIVKCCQVSAIIEFSPDKIIIGADSYNSQMTFFILEGTSKIIYKLDVCKKKDSFGKTYYKLYKPKKEANSNLTFEKPEYSSMLFNTSEKTQKEETNLTVSSTMYATNEISLNENNLINVKNEEGKTNEVNNKDNLQPVVEEDIQIKNSKDLNNDKSNDSNNINKYESDHHKKILKESREKLEKVKKPSKTNSDLKKEKNVETFFMEIAFFHKGACFGLEENLNEKFFIMSATKLKCLRIPKKFLLEHNHCNIWNSIRLFFNLYLPDEKKILKNFVCDRNWSKMKRKHSEKATFTKNIPNYTLNADVPFSLRLMEIPTQ